MSAARIHDAFLLLVLANIVAIVHIAGLALATIDARVGISKVRLFHGPRIADLVIRGICIEIGCIPTGGYIELSDGVLESGSNTLSATRRIALRLNGCIATFLLAVLILGVAKSVNSILVGFGQSVVGAIAPVSEGQGLMRGLLVTISGGHVVYSLGFVASKLTSLNLILAICQLAVDQVNRSSRWGRYAFAGTMLMVISSSWLFIGWFVAILLSMRS